MRNTLAIQPDTRYNRCKTGGAHGDGKRRTNETDTRATGRFSHDEILRELTFNLMIQRGLKDSDESKTISNEEMAHRIRSWGN